jgi:hypothetical protein
MLPRLEDEQYAKSNISKPKASESASRREFLLISWTLK